MTATGICVRGPPGRALPRVRRALKRGRPARATRSRTTSRRARGRRSSTPIGRPSRPHGDSGPATTPPTSRCRGCCPPAGTGCSSTTPRRAATASAPTARDAWSVEVDAPSCAAASSPVRAPPTSFAASPTGSGASRSRRRRGFSGRGSTPGRRTQPPPERERAAVAAQRSSDVPVSAVETHLRYLPCGAATAEARARAGAHRVLPRRGAGDGRLLQPRGVPRPTAPRCDDGREPGGAASATRLGDPYAFDAFVGGATPLETPVSQIDFSAPGAEAFYAEQPPRPSRTATTAGWRTSASTRRPTRWPRTAMAGTRCTTSTRCSTTARGSIRARQSRPIVRHSPLGLDRGRIRTPRSCGAATRHGVGLRRPRSRRCARRSTMGLSGIGIWGSDIGGFFALAADELTPELLKRWVQFGAVSGVMRTKHGGVGDPPSRAAGLRPRPDPQLAPLREASYPALPVHRRRRRLLPAHGMPLMRHLALRWPGDRDAVAREDEFMFGPDLLAAPVLEPGATERELYLPRGRWVDFWDASRTRRRAATSRSARPTRARASGPEGPRADRRASADGPRGRRAPAPAGRRRHARRPVRRRSHIRGAAGGSPRGATARPPRADRVPRGRSAIGSSARSACFSASCAASGG